MRKMKKTSASEVARSVYVSVLTVQNRAHCSHRRLTTVFQVKQHHLPKADGKIISNIFKPLKGKPLTEESTSSSPQEAAGFMGNVDPIC